MKAVIRKATEEEKQTLKFWDFSRLKEVNTCPKYASVRYGLNLRWPNSKRAMALEAGAACHEVFAADRVWRLRYMQDLPEHADAAAMAMFGEDKYFDMMDQVVPVEDDQTNRMNFCLQALYNSGFYDDPYDKRRTLANLEEACTLYLRHMERYAKPVWVKDKDDAEKFIGVETPFHLCIEIEDKKYGFFGRIDGAHINRQNRVGIEENKSAYRLDQQWEDSFAMTMQITGYMVALSALIDEPVFTGEVHGLCIPIPRDVLNGVKTVPVSRQQFQINDWLKWFMYSVDMYEQNADPLTAMQFTHSCNRFFRSCSLLPLCASPTDEQEEMLAQMEYEEWDPTK